MISTGIHYNKLKRLLFPSSQRWRVAIHVLFWIAFVGYHLLFFVPSFIESTPSKAVVLAYLGYYLRYIPLYYFLTFVYSLAGRTLPPLVLVAVLFSLSLAVMDLLTRLFYEVLNVSGFHHFPAIFEEIGRYYLYRSTSLPGWQAITYDLIDMQLLIFPLGVRLVKAGLEKEIQQHETSSQRLKAELALLRSQLTPHFMLNVLNAAYAELGRYSKKGAEYLIQVSDLLRFALYEAGKEQIALHKELRYIERYIDLEILRSGRRIEISFTRSGSVLPEHQLPTMLLISLVENAFKHCIHSSADLGRVNVDCRIDANNLFFSVENSIPQHKLDSNDSQSGLGLVSIQRILKLNYPDRHSFVVTQTGAVFKVVLVLSMNGF